MGVAPNHLGKGRRRRGAHAADNSAAAGGDPRVAVRVAQMALTVDDLIVGTPISQSNEDRDPERRRLLKQRRKDLSCGAGSTGVSDCACIVREIKNPARRKHGGSILAGIREESAIEKRLPATFGVLCEIYVDIGTLRDCRGCGDILRNLVSAVGLLAFRDRRVVVGVCSGADLNADCRNRGLRVVTEGSLVMNVEISEDR